jgi:hypothetical protein
MISGLERGTRGPKRAQIDAFDKVLSTGGALLHLWIELNGRSEIPNSWRSFLELERAAIEIREYSSAVIPGLLQSRGYAHAMMANGMRLAGDDDSEDLLTVRLERMSKLLPGVRLWFIVEESVLSKVFGSESVQAEALDHLVDMARLPHVRLAVVPQNAPERPGLAGAFRVMRLPDGRSVAHVEHALGEMVVNDLNEVGQLLTVFGDLQHEALTSRASVARIKEIGEAIHGMAQEQLQHG